MVCFFPIVVSLVDGFEKVDRDYINLFSTINELFIYKLHRVFLHIRSFLEIILYEIF